MKLSGVIKRFMCLSLTAALTLGSVNAGTLSLGVKDVEAATSTSYDDYEEIISTYSIDGNVPDYTEYIAGVDQTRPEKTIVIPADSYSRYSNGKSDNATPDTVSDYEGMPGTSVKTTEEGLIEYDVKVDQAGLYDLSLTYYPIKGNNSDIQRAIFIDGELPYSQLALVEFYRIWSNSITEEKVDNKGVTLRNWVKDNQGNDLKPKLIEAPEWITTNIYDADGYITSKLSIYLTAGTHTITLVSIKEPMLINKITLSNEEDLLSYSDQLAAWNSAGAQDASGDVIRIEAENANRTSSQMLYPTQDQSSPAVYPASSKALLNNTIGGNSWRLVNQWIEWDVNVPADGYYNIAVHARQNFVKGVYVSRKIMIDGKVPFKEFEDYGFKYKQKWTLETLKDDDGKAFKIYLTAGTHTIRMQNVFGEFSQLISGVQDCVSQLNSIYRKIIRITGTEPDEFRDYEIAASLPGLNAELVAVRDQLTQIIKDLREVAGKSDKETVLKTMRDQLNELIKNEERFTEIINDYKTNVRALGTWITTMLSQPLQLDTIYIKPAANTKKIKVKSSGFWSRFGYEMSRLFYSFIIDYNQVGNVAEDSSNSKTLTLWVGTGRDQANVIKSLIDETFTPNSGVAVNVMLVDMNTLLQATLAGQGPDVAIQVGQTAAIGQAVAAAIQPMDYGLRSAVIDLSTFPDLEQFVSNNFNESAMAGYRFAGATYALPETQTFPMMFYRKDILKELSLEVPQTWEDVKVAMSVLSKNQMEFGMLPGENIFAMLLYQNGGQYYTDDARQSALDNEFGVNAFKQYCEFYTDYKLDKATPADERFRTGEAPIIIADYTLYNNLAVSAPDIKGLWGFAPVPGTVNEDGTIDRTVASSGTGAMIMSATKEPDAAWEFLKWWTSADTQLSYNAEMESLMGSAARVATANMTAFDAMPWNTSDKDALLEQFRSVKGIPQVPGGYYSYRNVNNAFYRVTTNPDEVSPREELMDQIVDINAEINYKRKEFNLPVADEDAK